MIGQAPYLVNDEDEVSLPPRAQEPSRLARLLEEARQKNRADLGLAGLGAASVLGSFVQRATVRSSILPQGGVSWEPGKPGPPKAAGGTVGEWLWRVLRINVGLDTEVGRLDYAPSGRGDGELFPLVAAGAVLGGAGILYVIARGIAAMLRERNRTARSSRRVR